MSIGDRIKSFRQGLKPKMTQTVFGERLGLSRDAVNNLENGRVEPSEATLRHICQTYGINYVWLKTGEGKMDPEPVEDDTPGRLMARYRKGSPSTKKLLRIMAELDDDWFDKIDAVLRRLESEAAQSKEEEESD